MPGSFTPVLILSSWIEWDLTLSQQDQGNSVETMLWHQSQNKGMSSHVSKEDMMGFSYSSKIMPVWLLRNLLSYQVSLRKGSAMGEPGRCQFLQIPEDMDGVPSWRTGSTELSGAREIHICWRSGPLQPNWGKDVKIKMLPHWRAYKLLISMLRHYSPSLIM